MGHLSNDHENHPNQHENSHKLCNEMRHPIVNQLESQWKLRQWKLGLSEASSFCRKKLNMHNKLVMLRLFLIK